MKLLDDSISQQKVRTCVVPCNSALFQTNIQPIGKVLGLLLLQELVDRVCIPAIHINLVLADKLKVADQLLCKLQYLPHHENL